MKTGSWSSWLKNYQTNILGKLLPYLKCSWSLSAKCTRLSSLFTHWLVRAYYGRFTLVCLIVSFTYLSYHFLRFQPFWIILYYYFSPFLIFFFFRFFLKNVYDWLKLFWKRLTDACRYSPSSNLFITHMRRVYLILTTQALFTPLLMMVLMRGKHRNFEGRQQSVDFLSGNLRRHRAINRGFNRQIEKPGKSPNLV